MLLWLACTRQAELHSFLRYLMQQYLKASQFNLTLIIYLSTGGIACMHLQLQWDTAYCADSSASCFVDWRFVDPRVHFAFLF
jgi:hypothetical protein